MPFDGKKKGSGPDRHQEAQNAAQRLVRLSCVAALDEGLCEKCFYGTLFYELKELLIALLLIDKTPEEIETLLCEQIKHSVKRLAKEKEAFEGR